MYIYNLYYSYNIYNEQYGSIYKEMCFYFFLNWLTFTYIVRVHIRKN
jgi:hypothetical protein